MSACRHMRRSGRAGLVVALLLVPAAMTHAADTRHLCEPAGTKPGKPGDHGAIIQAVDAVPQPADDGLPVSTLAAEGFRTEPIAEMIDVLGLDYFEKLDSILIARNGKLVFEAYFNGFDAETTHDTRSAFKSITATLAGIALERGDIDSVDVPMQAYFPDYWTDLTGDRALKAQITLDHLLTMTPGFEAEENFNVGPFVENDMWRSDDWYRFSLDLPMWFSPGKQFLYNSSTTFLIGAIVARASGMPLPEFAKANLFDPLGITEYCWTLTPKGRAVAQGSFFMRPRDMLKFGQMILNGGVWKGKRIVSERWIEEASHHRFDAVPPGTDQVGIPTMGYGYQWWTERPEAGEDPRVGRYFASGNGGQKIYVFPDLDMVVVFTGGNYNKPIGHKQPNLILDRWILPAVL